MENKAISNTKLQQVLLSIGLDIVGIYLRDDPFSTDIGLVKLHPTKGTHWVCYINENYFDSYSCVFPNNFHGFIIKRNGHCLVSEYKIQGLTSKRGSSCASYRIYIIYLTNL